MLKNKKLRFMNIKDKTQISNEKFCPPHYFPHKIPLGEKIKDEPCHYHNKKWRMKHHVFGCRILRCSHYEFMLEQYKNKTL